MIRRAGVVLCVLLMLSCSAGDREQSVLRDFVVVPPPMMRADARPPAHVHGLIARASQSYVTVSVARPSEFDRGSGEVVQEAETAGSGFAITADGLIMTAGHVAAAAGNRVEATGPDGVRYRGEVAHLWRGDDIAVIKLAEFRTPPVVPVSHACLKPGAAVFSLGRPSGGRDAARFGSVITMRDTEPGRYGKFGYDGAMAVGLATERGESGGPVFTDKGEFAGMLVSALSDGENRPLMRAHAISPATVAGYVCRAVTPCPSYWLKLARQADRPCPAESG